MSKYVDITLRDKSWLFPGSVKTYSCPPSQNCSECGGSGKCTSCAGKGEIRCSYCGGKGDVVCQWCNGSGHDGNGKECYFCHGRRYLKCSSCNGEGFEKCRSCGGSGSCYNCGGSGQVTCRRCQGLGCYQTFQEYTPNYVVRQLCNPGPTPELEDGLRLATGEELCRFTAKSWQKADKLQFDNTERCMDKVIAASGEYGKFAEEFRKAYGETPEMGQTVQDYQPYFNTVRANRVPCTRVKYVLNEKEYEMVFVGTNGVTCYPDIPASIKAFDVSENDKAYMKRIAYKRHRAVAALTAYIFNLDGMDPMESKSLNLLLKHMCLNALARDRMAKYLSRRYTLEVDQERMLDKIQCLFMSKRTICYAWQCMAVDKMISPQEQEFFDRLVARYGISDAEVNTLKRYATKFAKLEDDQFAKEYLESPAVFRDPYYRVWTTVIVLGLVTAVVSAIVALFLSGSSMESAWAVAAVSLGVAIFFFWKHNPFQQYDQKSVDRVYKKVTEEQDLKEADYIQSALPYRIWYKIVDIQISLAAKVGILYDKFRTRTKKTDLKKIAGPVKKIDIKQVAGSFKESVKNVDLGKIKESVKEKIHK